MSQTGNFNLYHSGRSLSLTSPDQVDFSNSNPIAIDFAGPSGQLAKFLVTNQIYFPVIQNRYLYQTDDPYTFALSSSPNLNGRLFFYLPVSGPHIYTSDCNFNGYFFIHGPNVESSTLAEFNIHILDVIRLIPVGIDEPVTIAKDCTPNCQGTRCTDDNGCGLPCGCPNNQICTSGGVCQAGVDSSAPMPMCLNQSQLPGNNQNGTPITCEGPCFGYCPYGSQCIRDANGLHTCVARPASSGGFWLTIILVIIAILAAIFMFIWLRRRNPAQITPQVYSIQNRNSLRG